MNNYYSNETLHMMIQDKDNHIDWLYGQLKVLNDIIEDETGKKIYYKDKYVDLLKTLNKNRPNAQRKAVDTVERKFNEKFEVQSPEFVEFNDDAYTQPVHEVPEVDWSSIGTRESKAVGTTTSEGPGLLGSQPNRKRKNNTIKVDYNGETLEFNAVNDAATWLKHEKNLKGKIKTIASNISYQTKPNSKKKHVSGLVFYY